MAIVRWDPFAGTMHSPFDDFMNGVWGTALAPAAHGTPAMDVYTDDDKSLVAEVQAPGFAKDDIEVQVHDGVLVIKGEKHDKEEQGKAGKRNYMVRESHASFYRSVALPKVADGDEVKAEFKDGLLKVTVPFRELPQPKKVAIAEGGKAGKK